MTGVEEIWCVVGRWQNCRSLTSFGMTIYGGTQVESHHLARKLKERATPAAKNQSQRQRTGVSALHNPSTRLDVQVHVDVPGHYYIAVHA